MSRIFWGLLIGGGLGALASQATLAQLFDRDWRELVAELDTRSAALLALVALPLLVILVRGWIGFLVSTLLVAGGSALALKLYVEDDAPWTEVMVMTGVYAVVATAVYHLLVRRVIG